MFMYANNFLRSLSSTYYVLNNYEWSANFVFSLYLHWNSTDQMVLIKSDA